MLYDPDCKPYVSYLQTLKTWFRSARRAIPPQKPENCKLKVKFSTFKKFWYTVLNIKWGIRVKSVCSDCTNLKSRIAVAKQEDRGAAYIKRCEEDLEYHLARAAYKKKRAYTNKINALYSWNIPNAEEVLQTYLNDLSDIKDDEDDCNVLNDVFFEDLSSKILEDLGRNQL